jgi:hypothetical protein
MLRWAVFLAVAPLFAGGFCLQMETPEANSEAKAQNAALVVRATGCQDPATAQVSGVAIRMTDGRKQTSPLKLIALKDPGTFAVMRDWPADTSVTLEFVGHNAGLSTSMLVRTRGDSVEKASAKFYAHVPTPQEEMAMSVR